MQNIPQASEHVAPLQLISNTITEDLCRYIDARIAVALDYRPSKTLDRREVCEILKISLPTLLKRVNDGTIKSTKLKRRVLFHRADIDALLQSKGVQA
jgi:excisionase family DNA binding protein